AALIVSIAALSALAPVAAAAPTNDGFASASAVSGNLPLFEFGTNLGATKQAGEPNHAGNADGHSISYSSTPSSSGPVHISTCGFGGIDTLLAVYTGSAVNGLTPVASNDDGDEEGCGPGDSEVELNANAGTAYRIAVDGKAGSEGSFDLELRG